MPRHLIVFLSIFFASCELIAPDNEDASIPVSIAIQASFLDTPIEVAVDGNVVYDTLATTNQIIGLAGGTQVSLPGGVRMISVLINGDKEKVDVFNPGDTPHIGINYFQQEITILKSRTPFVYF